MTGLERFRGGVVIVIAIVATVSAAPLAHTDARYVDSEVSAGTVSGGVLDLQLTQLGPATADSDTSQTDADAVTGTWVDYTHDTNGDDTISNTLELSNGAGTIDAETVDLTLSYRENDTDGGMSGNAESAAQTVIVDEFVYGDTDLLETEIDDENGDGRIDLDDLTRGETAENLSSLPGIDAGASRPLTISLTGRAELLDIISGGDGIDFDLAIRAVNGSVVDPDAARDNTIRYA